MNWPVPAPPVCAIDDPEEPEAGEPDPLGIEEPLGALGPDDPPAPMLGLEPGCMAGEPEVADPEPDAVGRSVAPDGAVVDCANAGTAASAVATRQAAMWVFSMSISWRVRESRRAQTRTRSTPPRVRSFRDGTGGA
jgi:hypothetical protein